MSSVAPGLVNRWIARSLWPYGPIFGLALLYLPSYVDVAHRFWSADEESHGPVVLAVVLYLICRERACFLLGSTGREFLAGFLLFIVGIALYIVGRSQEFFQFDLGSQVFVVAGLGLALGGERGLRRMWFPAFFSIFVIPIPPSLLDQILLPLKVIVSAVVTNGLYQFGYPIARSGVVLVIGQYHLLIADACSGLRSMVALSGIGFLYVYLVGHRSQWRNAALLAAAIPIAFFANVARVASLVLVTYHLGDEAGAAFHDFAGYFEIFAAFGSFFALDFLLTRLKFVRAEVLA